MITAGDDEGRLRGDAAFFKRVFFFDDHVSVEKLEKMIDRIHESGLILKYKVNDNFYILHPKWKKYQQLRADRSKPSEIPAPPSDIWQPSDTRTTHVFEIGKDRVSQDNLDEDNVGEDSVAIRAPEPKKSPREMMEAARNQALTGKEDPFNDLFFGEPGRGRKGIRI